MAEANQANQERGRHRTGRKSQEENKEETLENKAQKHRTKTDKHPIMTDSSTYILNLYPETVQRNKEKDQSKQTEHALQLCRKGGTSTSAHPSNNVSTAADQALAT